MNKPPSTQFLACEHHVIASTLRNNAVDVDGTRAATVQGPAMHRIHIIGGPGSGKSTLGRTLAARLGAPLYDLDEIAFERPAFTQRPLIVQQGAVQQIVGQPSWITEGIFLGWTDALLRAADMIIWLDHVRWHTVAWRIVRRFAHRGVAEAKRQPGRRKFTRFRDYAFHLHQLVGVLRSSKEYYNASTLRVHAGRVVPSRAATAHWLAPYHTKVLRCGSAADVATLVQVIELLS